MERRVIDFRMYKTLLFAAFYSHLITIFDCSTSSESISTELSNTYPIQTEMYIKDSA